MARILCVTSDLTGMLYSSVELARRLSTAGHDVTYFSAPAARELVEQQGLEFAALAPNGFDKFLRADAASGALARLADLSGRRERALEATGVDSFVRTVRDQAPELLLIDGELHELIIAASATGVPIALLNTFVSIWRQPGMPPPHRLFQPGAGWWGTQTGISLLWLQLRARKRIRALLLRARRIGCDRLTLLRRLAREADFDFDGETDDSQWPIPFTYQRLPVLSLHALELEFPHQPPERVHYVGPMLLESRIDRRITAEVRAELEAIFDRRRGADGSRKLIFAGFGSFFSTETDLLRRIVEAVAGRDDWELIISLGGRVDPAELGSLPERVHAFAWVPQLEVLRHADLSVNHGGINTIDECVTHGVPSLMYCGLETDMPGTVARAVFHGVGIAGDLRRDGPDEICEQIESLLEAPRFSDCADRMRGQFAAYRENRVAERIVGALLAGTGKGSSTSD